MPENKNVVYIGSKYINSYIMAVVRQFDQSGADRIVLKARGAIISRAVEVAEALKNRFMKDQIEIESIKTSTEEVSDRRGHKSNVPSIEITLKKIRLVIEDHESSTGE